MKSHEFETMRPETAGEHSSPPHTWTGPKFQIPKAGQLGRLADYAITRWQEASAGPAHHCCSLCIAACRWMFMR